MKIKKDTVTFERNDTVFFDGIIISNGHMAIDTSKVFCFKFKFPDDRLTAAYISKQKFTYQNKQVAVGEDCAWMPNLEAAFSSFKLDEYYEAEITPLQWHDAHCAASYTTGKFAWLDAGYLPLLQGFDPIVKDAYSPVYALVAGVPAVCITHVLLSKYPTVQKLTDDLVGVLCAQGGAK